MFERGGVYLASLNPSKGAEPGKVRPVLVIQSDMLNHVGHTTIIVVPLSTKLVDDAYPLRYRVSKRDKLLHDSDLLCDQIRAIDRKRLIEGKLTQFDEREMFEIEQQIQAILEFD